MLYSSYPEESALYPKLGLPPDDPTLMMAQSNWATPLPIFLYLAAYAAIELYALFLYLVINVMGRIATACCTR